MLGAYNGWHYNNDERIGKDKGWCVRSEVITQPASVKTDAGIFGLAGSRRGETKEHFREVGSGELGYGRQARPLTGVRSCG